MEFKIMLPYLVIDYLFVHIVLTDKVLMLLIIYTKLWKGLLWCLACWKVVRK